MVQYGDKSEFSKPTFSIYYSFLFFLNILNISTPVIYFFKIYTLMRLWEFPGLCSIWGIQSAVLHTAPYV